jgi:hypothetical protein
MNREAKHVYDLVVKPLLPLIGLDSPSARLLMVCTGQVETAYDNLRQVLPDGNYGEGYGWWSQQKNSYDNCVKYLNKVPKLKESILASCYLGILPSHDALIWNVRLACCMARVHYWQIPERLPAFDDLEGLAKYWKKYYNTPRGSGTVERFLAECKDIIIF